MQHLKYSDAWLKVCFRDLSGGVGKLCSVKVIFELRLPASSLLSFVNSLYFRKICFSLQVIYNFFFKLHQILSGILHFDCLQIKLLYLSNKIHNFFCRVYSLVILVFFLSKLFFGEHNIAKKKT